VLLPDLKLQKEEKNCIKDVLQSMQADVHMLAQTVTNNLIVTTTLEEAIDARCYILLRQNLFCCVKE
jgi:hypothetical protein